jgi:hypothetical protein
VWDKKGIISGILLVLFLKGNYLGVIYVLIKHWTLNSKNY